MSTHHEPRHFAIQFARSTTSGQIFIQFQDESWYGYSEGFGTDEAWAILSNTEDGFNVGYAFNLMKNRGQWDDATRLEDLPEDDYDFLPGFGAEPTGSNELPFS